MRPAQLRAKSANAGNPADSCHSASRPLDGVVRFFSEWRAVAARNVGVDIGWEPTRGSMLFWRSALNQTSGRGGGCERVKDRLCERGRAGADPSGEPGARSCRRGPSRVSAQVRRLIRFGSARKWPVQVDVRTGRAGVRADGSRTGHRRQSHLGAKSGAKPRGGHHRDGAPCSCRWP